MGYDTGNSRAVEDLKKVPPSLDADIERAKTQQKMQELEAKIHKEAAAREQEIAESVQKKCGVMSPAEMVDALFAESRQAFVDGKPYQGTLFARAGAFIHNVSHK